jgi:hypothetical protein
MRIHTITQRCRKGNTHTHTYKHLCFTMFTQDTHTHTNRIIATCTYIRTPMQNRKQHSRIHTHMHTSVLDSVHTYNTYTHRTHKCDQQHMRILAYKSTLLAQTHTRICNQHPCIHVIQMMRYLYVTHTHTHTPAPRAPSARAFRT